MGFLVWAGMGKSHCGELAGCPVPSKLLYHSSHHLYGKGDKIRWKNLVGQDECRLMKQKQRKLKGFHQQAMFSHFPGSGP